jgi:hypothetical protein
VIIAMPVMWVMQPSLHEIIDVITVGHPIVSAARPMRVRASGVGRAAQGIGVADLDNVFVDMIPMHVMQMTIMEVIDMAVMAHSRVSTVRTMLMGVIRMMRLVAEGHRFARLSWVLSGGDAGACGRRVLIETKEREHDAMVCPLRDIATAQSLKTAARPTKKVSPPLSAGCAPTRTPRRRDVQPCDHWDHRSRSRHSLL